MKKIIFSVIVLMLPVFLAVSCNVNRDDVPDLEPHLHVMGDWDVTLEPTCTSEGSKTSACHCGYTETESIPELGHKYSEATCEAPATCEGCGATEGEPLEHEYSEATCASPATCKYCKETVGSTLDHIYGYDARCVNCKEYAPVGPYKFVPNGDGTCTLTSGGSYNVHAVIPSYSPDGEKVTIIDSAFSGSSCLQSVVIPDTVEEIRYQAFSNCNNLTDVTIPNSVKMIGAGAFGGCSSLTKIEIPDSVTYIDEGAFVSCINLKSVIIPNNVTTIGKDAFNSCTGLESVTIGKGVKTVGTNAFRNCYIKDVYISDLEAWCKIDFEWYDSNPLYGYDYNEIFANLYLNGELVEDLVIPDGITEIKTYAFFKCGSIKAVTIPDDVKAIDESAFSNLMNLETLVIGNGVKDIGFSAFAGCGKLVNLTIGSNVEIIGNTAFRYCSSLEEVRIPESVKIIDSYSFSDCTALRTLIVGSAVERVGMWAFHNANNLQKVFYTGTSEQWSAITFEKDYYGGIDDLKVIFDYPKD